MGNNSEVGKPIGHPVPFGSEDTRSFLMEVTAAVPTSIRSGLPAVRHLELRKQDMVLYSPMSSDMNDELFLWFGDIASTCRDDPIAIAIEDLSYDNPNMTSTVCYSSDIPCNKLNDVRVYDKLHVNRDDVFSVVITVTGFPLMLMTNSQNLNTYKAIMRNAMALLAHEVVSMESNTSLPMYEPVLLFTEGFLWRGIVLSIQTVDETVYVNAFLLDLGFSALVHVEHIRVIPVATDEDGRDWIKLLLSRGIPL